MKIYRLKLTDAERADLEQLLSKGKAAARTLTHARILLKTDEGVAGPRWTDDAIAEPLEVNRSTVERVRVRGVEEGVDARCDRVHRANSVCASSTCPGGAPHGAGV